MKGGHRGVQVSLKSQDQARCLKPTSMRYQSERAKAATIVEGCLYRLCQTEMMPMSVVEGKESGGCVQHGRASRNERVQRNVMTTFPCNSLIELRSTRRPIFVKTNLILLILDDRRHLVFVRQASALARPSQFLLY